jgi:[ribosomal protein S5]-alanine N-acetyltransferase
MRLGRTCRHKLRDQQRNGLVKWVPPAPRLEAGQVALRPFEASDAAVLAAACQDADILRFTFMTEGLTEAQALQWIEKVNERFPAGQPRFAIVDPDDDHLLGQVGLAVNEQALSAEGYYWVAPAARGRGAAFQALGLIADWAFWEGIERLFLLIHSENHPSNRLAAKTGFTREGVLRAYEPIKGRRPDLVSWSLLPTDPRPWHQQMTRPR